jgi:hypothetical protein
MWLHSTNTPAYARRHPRSRFVDSEVDVPATFLGARERHVTRAELAPPAPKGHTCLVPPADEASYVAGGARETPPTYGYERAVGGGGRRRLESLRSVGGRAEDAASRRRLLPPAGRGKPGSFWLVRTDFFRSRRRVARHGVLDRKQPQAAIARVPCAPSHDFFFWKLKLPFWTENGASNGGD